MARKAGDPSRHKIARKEQELQVLELYKAGYTYAKIAKAIGITRGATHKIVHRVFDQITKEVDQTARHQQQLDLSRLDVLLAGLWEQARKGHLGAVDRTLKILERRARLLGLDAPSKKAVYAEIEAGPSFAGKVNVYIPDNGRGDSEQEPGK